MKTELLRFEIFVFEVFAFKILHFDSLYRVDFIVSGGFLIIIFNHESCLSGARFCEIGTAV